MCRRDSHKHIRDIVGIAPLLAAYKTSEKYFVGDAKISSQLNQLITLLTVTSQHKRQFVVFLASTRKAAQKIDEALLNSKARDCRDDRVALTAQRLEIAIGATCLLYTSRCV